MSEIPVTVPFVSFRPMERELDAELRGAFAHVLDNSWYIGGREDAAFENEYDALLKNAPGARITAWWDRAADIIPAGGSKGIGIKKILEYYQIAPYEAMAFGDGNNDIEMIQTVGNGIAMANASSELKAAACDICGHAAEDGIYYYLKDRGLI